MTSPILDLYNSSNAPNVVNARNQSEGKLEANYFDGVARGPGNNIADQIQKEFSAREPGQKKIELAIEEDATRGSWLPPAFRMYDEFLNRVNLSSYHGKLVHIYDKYNKQFVKIFSQMPGVVRHYAAF